jgi:hypothetical protein
MTAAPTLAAGVAYLVVFAIGSIAGMLVLSTLMSLPLSYLETRYAAFHRRVQLAAGVASVAFGLCVVAQRAWAGGALAWIR